MLEFRLLGPVEVQDGTTPVHVRGRRTRALLACLLLRHGEVVASERLIDDLWGEQAPQTARNSLHNNISALRKALGDDLIVTTADGYAVSVGADAVDSARFERLLEEARAETSDEERVATLREALALWRGPALANVAFEPFALLEAPRLEELRLAAREDLIDAELALNRHGAVLPELEELVAAHPFDERLRAQLMLCLYRSGRQADALAAYRDAREFLIEELGIEPSPPLRNLEQAILRHDDALAPVPQARPNLLPARRTLTVLVADVAEPASVSGHLDPEVFHGVVDRSVAIIRAVVERHGGAVQNLVGDTFLAVFGVPARHEDDALRAVRAAVELREELAELRDQVEVRIGIDSGEAFVADGAAGARVTGAAIRVARQLGETASPGEILLGAGAVRLIGSALKTQPLAPVPLRGTVSVSAWRLLELVQGAAAIPRTLEAPLIGRRAELAELQARFDDACVAGRCRHVVLVGEAGIGKSRLARELATAVEAGATVLVGRCVSYGEGATWLPLAEIVREAGGSESLPSLLKGERDGELVSRRIAGAIGVEGEVTAAEETWWAVRRLFETLAKQRPLVVVFEDVHWAETGLLDMIEYLAARACGPLMVLALTRPELLETRTAWREGSITLEALPEADMTSLVASLAGALDPEGRRRVVEVAEGNPLFAEQLVARAVEEGPASLDSVPPSIEGLLAGRLDLLPPVERSVIQAAAIVGRRFARATVVALSALAAATSVDEELRSLTQKGFIRATRGGDVLSFHHVLVRNAAYAGIPKSARADMHERVGTWLDETDAAAEEVVGYHFEQAYRYHSEVGREDSGLQALARRAAERLGAAGKRAAARDDWHAAANLLSRATTLLSNDDAEQPPLLVLLGESLYALGEPAEATRVLEEATASARSLGDSSSEWRALIERSLFQRTTREEGWLGRARIDAQRAIGLFTDLDDDQGLATAWRFGSWIEQWNGQYGAAVASLERALEHARRAGDIPEAKRILSTIGPNLVFGPVPAPAAADRLSQELALADAEGHLALSASLCRDLAALQAMRGRFDEARSSLARATTILHELDLVSDLGLCASFGGYVEGLAGDLEAAEREHRAAWAIFDQTGESCRKLTAEVELAHILLERRRTDEALRLAEVAQRDTPADEFYCHVLWRTARAKGLATKGDLSDAQSLARAALALAEKTDDLSTHAGVLVDLGTVLCADDNVAEAVPLFQNALVLYERKGNVVLASRTRALLDRRRTAAAVL